MKKTLALCLISVTVAAHAATVNWGATSLYYGTDKTLNGNTVGYLVYLGDFDDENDVSYDSIDIEQLASKGNEYSKVAAKEKPGTSTLGKGKIAGETDSVEFLNNIVPVDGSSYFGTVYITTQDSEQYYITGATHVYDTTSASYDSTMDTFSWRTDKVESGSATTQGWASVPEPSVAIMGLLGLGMLLKRRRA